MEKPKIFPRNLTARAAFSVEGNPANSRPESALDTSSPGLEVDIRNLEQRFFPGLVFEFQRFDGAILSALELTPEQRISGLTESDCFGAKRLYLWAMYGRSNPDKEPKFHGFGGLRGMNVWRRIRDLAPGRVAIVFGPQPGKDNEFHRAKALPVLANAFGAKDLAQRFVVKRDSSAAIQYAVFVADRAPYLDRHGVVDTEAFGPGELTKTTCAPWIFDFRECSCFYWSANKPDMVSSDTQRYLDFFRDRTKYANTQDLPSFDARHERQAPVERLATGEWEKLPMILNDQEEPEKKADSGIELFNRAELMAELRYLATVEHALLVEYLYAHYSVDAPAEKPVSGLVTTPVALRYTMAREVFRIAVDEMRHFVWANHLLAILGGKPSLARAGALGAPPVKGDGRRLVPDLRYLNQPFALDPLSRGKLRAFLGVERISQQLHDGMYIHLLHSVTEQPNMFPEHERLVPVLKLLIDEGQNHFERLTAVEATANSLKEGWLRSFDAKPTADQSYVRELCAQLYHLVLEAIAIDFSLGDSAGGEILEVTKKFMSALNCLILRLAGDHVDFKFDLPAAYPEQRLDWMNASALVEQRRQKILQNARAGVSLSEPYRSAVASCMAGTEILFGHMSDAIQQSR
jgi:hypothetical protein